MDCFFCKSPKTRVLQVYKRWRIDVDRRTHECANCGERFASLQMYATLKLVEILKKRPKVTTGSRKVDGSEEVEPNGAREDCTTQNERIDRRNR